MNVKALLKNVSDGALAELQKSVLTALKQDDEAQARATPVTYGCGEFPDWRAWGDALEEELRAREISFEPIAW